MVSGDLGLGKGVRVCAHVCVRVCVCARKLVSWIPGQAPSWIRFQGPRQWRGFCVGVGHCQGVCAHSSGLPEKKGEA